MLPLVVSSQVLISLELLSTEANERLFLGMNRPESDIDIDEIVSNLS